MFCKSESIRSRTEGDPTLVLHRSRLWVRRFAAWRESLRPSSKDGTGGSEDSLRVAAKGSPNAGGCGKKHLYWVLIGLVTFFGGGGRWQLYWISLNLTSSEHGHAVRPSWSRSDRSSRRQWRPTGQSALDEFVDWIVRYFDHLWSTWNRISIFYHVFPCFPQWHLMLSSSAMIPLDTQCQTPAINHGLVGDVSEFHHIFGTIGRWCDLVRFFWVSSCKDWRSTYGAGSQCQELIICLKGSACWMGRLAGQHDIFGIIWGWLVGHFTGIEYKKSNVEWSNWIRQPSKTW